MIDKLMCQWKIGIFVLYTSEPDSADGVLGDYSDACKILPRMAGGCFCNAFLADWKY